LGINLILTRFFVPLTLTKLLSHEIAFRGVAGYFDPKTFSFIIGFFDIDKEEMQCYTKKRLNQPHWI
jgi:hypothetical protein